MDIRVVIIWSVVGAIVGWLAGKIMKGSRVGLVGDIIVGIIGALLGGYLLGMVLGSLGMFSALITGIGGAVILLFVVKLFIKK